MIFREITYSFMRNINYFNKYKEGIVMMQNNTLNEMMEPMDGMMELVKEQMTFDSMMTLGQDEFVLIKEMFRLYDLTKKYIVELTEAQKAQAEKLDKIINMLEKMEKAQ